MTGAADLGLDLGTVLGGLKDFQLDTVAHVVDRLYGDDPVDRYLVADEVGLGKTLVAKGVIALAIEKLQECRGDRIDVVYICSNADIARQNLARLNPTRLTELNFNERLTMLPRAFARLRQNPVNFIAFTPGTSFNLRSAEGKAGERVLLYHLLRRCWGSGVVGGGNPDKRVFQGWARFEGFKSSLSRFDPSQLDAQLVASFEEALGNEADHAVAAGRPPLEQRYRSLRDDLRWLRANSPPQAVSRERARFVGDVRELLARTCIQVLDPSLVILDEFQRFRGLLDGGDETAELAGTLLSHPGVKVLLLSATPYKMYTIREELEDDHYADLLRTIRFLAGTDSVPQFTEDLRTFRRELLSASDGYERVAEVKDRIEQQLRRVMVRTEKLAATKCRGGMLTERPSREVRLEARDVREFVGLQRVSQLLGAGGVTDYWKSSGYPLNFMEGYKLDRELARAAEDERNGELTETLAAADWLLSRRDIESYRALDPGNARLRSLLSELVDEGLWQVAWLPPSLPYYEPGPPYDRLDPQRTTKRLVFSAWKVVPKVLATLLSYEAERRMATLGDEERSNTAETRRSFQPLLRLQRASGRLTGMPVVGLLYPSPRLAELVDPLRLAAAGHRPTMDEALEAVRHELAAPTAELTSAAPEDGVVDERWYWALPMLLDRAGLGQEEDEIWWDAPDLVARWQGAEQDDLDEHGSLREHLAQARDVVADPSQLGRAPDDLAAVTTRLALAGPGTAALRALHRVAPEMPIAHVELRHQAASVAWAFRSLFNRPEITWLLRGASTGSSRSEGRYWRLVLEHALAGNIQAMLDEHAHVLVEWTGVVGHPAEERLSAVTERMREALTTRAVNYRVTDVQVEDRKLHLEQYTMRGQFAVRFGDDRSEQDHSVVRQGHVRTAFNSPYWPFVLATTSVGQEGLDFHVYCHAVTHWNLPANPVDLEQREGRVHRYKGHAVRKNVASEHRGVIDGVGDPWPQVFDAATDARQEGASDLVPYWIYPVAGGASIERTVPALPLSSEVRRLAELHRTVAAYRMVFGQPRQEDLVAFLRLRHDRDLEALSERLRIDLSPPASTLEIPPPAPVERVQQGMPGAGPAAGPVRTVRQQRYARFWGIVLDGVHQRYPGWTSGRTPSKDSWMALPAGVSGIHYVAAFCWGPRLRVELYVDPAAELLRHRFWDDLVATRRGAERRFGARLEFEELPDARASRVASYLHGHADISYEEEWERYAAWTVDRLGRLRAALQLEVDRIVQEIRVDGGGKR
jgi:hypothetical protein